MMGKFLKQRTRLSQDRFVISTMKLVNIKKKLSVIYLVNVCLLLVILLAFPMFIKSSESSEQTDCAGGGDSSISREESSEQYIDQSLATDNQSLSLLDYSAINFSDDDIIVDQPEKVVATDRLNFDYSPPSLSSRSLWRRQVLNDGSVELLGPNTLALDYDSYRLPVAVDLPKSEAYTRRFLTASETSSSSSPSLSSSGSSSSSPSSLPNLQISSSSKDSTSQFQQQQKSGPQFIKEPPSFIHYLNSSDLVIPCSASGNPQPTIVSLLTSILPKCANEFKFNYKHFCVEFHRIRCPFFTLSLP